MVSLLLDQMSWVVRKKGRQPIGNGLGGGGAIFRAPFDRSKMSIHEKGEDLEGNEEIANEQPGTQMKKLQGLHQENS